MLVPAGETDTGRKVLDEYVDRAVIVSHRFILTTRRARDRAAA